MIGAIVLTLRHKPNVKRQSIAAQNARTRASAIEVRQVRPGQGIWRICIKWAPVCRQPYCANVIS